MLKKKNKIKEKFYGKELILDLTGCRSGIVCSKKKLKEYVVELCRLIKMKSYGKPLIKRFGFNQDFTVGYSLVQLIESSSITGHFSEFWNSAYLNIFSCKTFDTRKVIKFTKKFFQAKKLKNRLLIRK